jgi:inosine-uridine nucleoside N-ribohydrolase
MSEVTQIFWQIESGDCFAAEQLLPLVDVELRTLAAAKLAIATDRRSSMVSNRLSTRLCTFRLLVVVTFAAQLAPGAMSAVAAVNRPLSLVFDTDIGNDIDDALALGVIHALVSRGECELAAVTITKDHPLSAPFVDAVNTFYGRAKIPIGVVHNGPTPEPSRYTELANVKDGDQLRYPHSLLSGADAPDAVALLRRTLAAAEDGTVVIVQVGFSTNLARLLTSAPDQTCRLSGFDLVQKKVRLLSVMAGTFASTGDLPQAEYNVKMDVRSAQTVVSNWPSPIVFSGLEVGIAIEFPADVIERDFAYVAHHPLAEAYRLHTPPPQGRPSWDLTSVLYAIRPNGRYFDLSPSGRVYVANDGTTSFKPAQAGTHRYLIVKTQQQIRVREALTLLASQPPKLPVPCR